MRSGLCFLLTAFVAITASTFAYDWSTNPGDGTEANPYQISEPNHLNVIGLDTNLLNKYFILKADIDMSAYTGTQYNIIGNNSNPFTGFFDGNNHIIANLTYSIASYDRFIGLFGYVDSSGEIKNLTLVSVDIDATPSSDFVGALIGYNYGGSISNCVISGIVNGSGNLGGLVGYSSGGYLLNCHSGTIVIGDRYGIGGLAGIIGGTNVSFCGATGNVKGDEDSVGGLIGSASGANIYNCFASGNVTNIGNRYSVGGLIGDTSNCTVKNCYASGDVSGNENIGGLLGYHSGSVVNSYSTGAVSGNSEVGALIGKNPAGTIISSYFLETAGPDNGYGTPLDDPNMMIQANFVGLDFVGEDLNGENEIWRMCVDGVEYPRLSWEFARDGDFACGDGVDIFDLQALAEHWLLVGTAHPTEFSYACDANGDGQIDLADFAVLGENWQ